MEDIYLGLKKKKEDNADKVGLFKHILETLIVKMKKESTDFDALYQEIYYGGSYFDGLALGSSDFDLNIIFKSKNLDIKIVNLGRDDPLTNFGHLQVLTLEKDLTKEEKNILEDFDGRLCVSPDKIFAVLLSAVDKALSGEIQYKGRHYKITRSVFNPVVLVVKEKGELVFEVDLVPAFRMDIENFPTRSATKDNLVGFCNKFNIELRTFLAIALRNVENIQGRFEIDFHDLERDILYKKECAKKVIRLMKHLRNITGGQAKKVKSFLIKVVVMKKILSTPENYWNNKNLDRCFIDCLTSLKDGLKERSIPDIFYPKLNLVDRMDDRILNNNVKWLENLLEKFHKSGDITAMFGFKRESSEGITNPKLPATLKTQMDLHLEEFCSSITPALKICEEMNESAEKLVRLFRQKSNYTVKDWKLLGGYDSKTFLANGVELVIYIDNKNKSDVLNDFEEVLLMNSEEKEDSFKKTICSLSVSFKEIPYKVYVAVEYDSNLKTVQTKIMNYVRQGNNPVERGRYFEAELSIVRDDWVNSQTEFTKDIIRLCNYWNNSILWDQNTPERSLVLELLAMKTAKEELEKTSFPHHKKTFVKFLQKVQYLQGQIVIFDDYYSVREVPENIRNQVPLLLDPVNPTNNICREIGPDFYQMFSKCATTTLQMFDSGCENLQQIFTPQPMLWMLLQNKPIQLRPRRYLIQIKLYNSQMTKSVIRINPGRGIKDFVQNMLNVLSINIKNIETKKPGISDQELQREGEIFMNKMDNCNEDRKWASSTESHENKAVTLMVPLNGQNNGLFLSFDV